MTKYILGGGLSGLVASYYNPEYTVVAPEYGGFIDKKYGRAFVVLHATDAMCQLFDELDVPCFKKRIKIGYYDTAGGLRNEWSNNDDERRFARRYVEEKLPPRFQPGKDLELSAPGDEWEALFVDSSIVSALAENVESRSMAWVQSIDEDEITLQPRADETISVEWDRIISTLPATLFREVADTDWTLDHEATTYAELPREKIPDRYLDKPWNLLYTVDEAVEYHRVARNMLSSSFYVECLGDVDVYGAADQFVNGIGVISDEDLDAPYSGITFLGRYAEWQHDVRIDDVIERAKEGL